MELKSSPKEVTRECGLEGPGASCVHTVGKGGPQRGQVSAQALRLNKLGTRA